jgi:hypothetical protein
MLDFDADRRIVSIAGFEAQKRLAPDASTDIKVA